MAARLRLQRGCNARDHVRCNVRQPIHAMLAPARTKGAQTMTDRNTVVVKDGGGSGAGMILGVIAIIAIVAAIWFFALGPGAGSKSDTNDGGTTINVEVPTGAPNPS
jgi:hypothetical protein